MTKQHRFLVIKWQAVRDPRVHNTNTVGLEFVAIARIAPPGGNDEKRAANISNSCPWKQP
jgi:hypothetical protein